MMNYILWILEENAETDIDASVMGDVTDEIAGTMLVGSWLIQQTTTDTNESGVYNLISNLDEMLIDFNDQQLRIAKKTVSGNDDPKMESMTARIHIRQSRFGERLSA